MSDARLRDLERRARDDPAAALALLVELRRSRGEGPLMFDSHTYPACAEARYTERWLAWYQIPGTGSCGAALMILPADGTHECLAGHVSPRVVREELPF